MLTDPQEDYARGFVPFLGVNVYLDSRPLIPRAETEYWTEKAIKKLSEIRMSDNLKVLDLFCGSGCIGLAIMKHIPNAHVDFADIESRHFPTIQKPIRENDLSKIQASETQLIQSDVFDSLSKRYDFILANPPYIAHGSAAVASSVLEHEPTEALFADDNGFALIEKTVAGALAHLTERGQLWIEHDPEQSARLALLAATYGFSIATHPDQFGVARFSVLSSAMQPRDHTPPKPEPQRSTLH